MAAFIVVLIAAGCSDDSDAGSRDSAADEDSSVAPDGSPDADGSTDAEDTAVRLRDVVFGEVDEQAGVVFGEGVRSSGVNQSLAMDVFRPRDDPSTDRPVLILAFAGGFIEGSRSDPELRAIAMNFAQRGYVTASIDYRLFENRPADEDEAFVGVLQSVHDMRAAIRFFREDGMGANEFGVDPDRILVGGVSAGAVMAAITGALDEGDAVTPAVQAFLDANGGIPGNSRGNVTVSSAAQGVLSISGAVLDVSWIEADTAPIYAAHEEFDSVVPCSTGSTTELGPSVTISGACAMIPAAEAAGVANQFFFVEGATTHVEFSEDDLFRIVDEAAAFFFGEVLQVR
ncbi:MAG: alpha/beta hydrolase [Myxococcota bacterium]